VLKHHAMAACRESEDAFLISLLDKGAHSTAALLPLDILAEPQRQCRIYGEERGLSLQESSPKDLLQAKNMFSTEPHKLSSSN
jgi:hypothetical protein